MNRNKLILGGLLCSAIVAGGIMFLAKTHEQAPIEETQKEIINNKFTQTKTTPNKIEETAKPITIEKKINLYNYNNQLSLNAIIEISELPLHTKQYLEEFIENCENLLFFQRLENKIVLICEKNSELKRHNIEFVEFDITSGNHTITDIDEFDVEGRDDWYYDKLFKPKRPIKHIKYNKDKQVEFVEIWNYNPEESIKYEVKNADGDTISLVKEIIANETNMRLEHVFYNNEDEVRMSISLNYDGANLTRVTYYNADKTEEGASVFSEFSDGLKIKETIYTTDYKIKNKYEATYQDGLMVGITAFNEQYQEIAKYLAE